AAIEVRGESASVLSAARPRKRPLAWQTVSLNGNQQPKPDGTSEVKSKSTRPRLTVTGGRKNVANHVAAGLLSDLADEFGIASARTRLIVRSACPVAGNRAELGGSRRV